ncbi:MAG TPA: hypothetical protein VF669_06125 [Tepidisphaeraceae bacterium]|jgi:hypothetical protein
MSDPLRLPSSTSYAKIGGALGIAGSIIGIAIFVGGCFGFGASFLMSPIPLALGSIGLILTIVGGFQRNPGIEDAHVVAGYCINIAVISGALLEMSIWLNWSFFAGGVK